MSILAKFIDKDVLTEVREDKCSLCVSSRMAARKSSLARLVILSKYMYLTKECGKYKNLIRLHLLSMMVEKGDEQTETYPVKIDNFKEDFKMVTYFIHVKVLASNVRVLVTKVNGEALINLSAGSNTHRGKQKVNKVAVEEMLQKLVVKSRPLKNTGVFSLVVAGVKKNRTMLLSRLKDIFPISVLKTCNLSPHNGCRAKKLRRK